MTYEQWQDAFPEAAQAFKYVIAAAPWNHDDGKQGDSEAWAQQQVRFQIGQEAGGYAWRNNVGAQKTKEPCQCPSCGFKFSLERAPLRWGLANDSAALNKKFKSSDLICAIPRTVTADMVGKVIAQFGAIETKHPGWEYNPHDKHEAAQAAFLQLVNSIGGFAAFSTGRVAL